MTSGFYMVVRFLKPSLSPPRFLYGLLKLPPHGLMHCGGAPPSGDRVGGMAAPIYTSGSLQSESSTVSGAATKIINTSGTLTASVSTVSGYADAERQYHYAEGSLQSTVATVSGVAHVGEAFEMAEGVAGPGNTTTRLSGLSDFGGGRIESGLKSIRDTDRSRSKRIPGRCLDYSGNIGK